MLRPNPEIVQKYGVLIANALIDTSMGNVPIRILNSFSHTLTLHKECLIGFLENVTMESSTGHKVCTIGTSSKESDVPEHLKNMFNESCSNLNDEQKDKFKNLLMKYQSSFSKSSNDLGRTELAEHKIETGKAKPIKQPPRRIPLAKMSEVNNEIKEMLEKGIIEPSESPWSSPVVLVKKKDNTLRFCIDYRKLNDVTSKDSHPIPRIDTTLDALSGSRFYSTIDLKSGYWQVKVAEEDRPKTAFSIPGGGHW